MSSLSTAAGAALAEKLFITFERLLATGLTQRLPDMLAQLRNYAAAVRS